MSLAANLLRDKPDLSSKEDVERILDAPQRLCLPDRNDGNTQAGNHRFFGKTLAPVNTPETGTNLRRVHRRKTIDLNWVSR